LHSVHGASVRLQIDDFPAGHAIAAPVERGIPHPMAPPVVIR
jgi:hypothetical protein